MEFSPRKELQKKCSTLRSSFRASFRKSEKSKINYDSEIQDNDKKQHKYDPHYIIIKAVTEVLASNFKVSKHQPTNQEEISNRKTLHMIIDPVQVRI